MSTHYVVLNSTDLNEGISTRLISDIRGRQLSNLHCWAFTEIPHYPPCGQDGRITQATALRPECLQVQKRLEI